MITSGVVEWRMRGDESSPQKRWFRFEGRRPDGSRSFESTPIRAASFTQVNVTWLDAR